MILGSLVDIGVPLDHITETLRTVDFSGYRIAQSRVARRGLDANRIEVILEETDHGHSHGHDHAHGMNWRKIRTLIGDSMMDDSIKKRAIDVFATLAEAEGNVHGKPPEDVHFHEVGAVDSLADIIGCCIAVEYLSPDEIVCLPVALGSGRTLTCEHGRMPIPVPATAKILADRPVPKDVAAEIKHETVLLGRMETEPTR